MKSWTGISLAALSACIVQPVLGQEVADNNANSPSNFGVADIVVTAQKRAENLQDVPVAVTAISAEVIANARIENIADLRAMAPNLYVITQAGGNGIPATTMRGQLSSAASNPTVDNGISYYIDGVYLGALSGIIFDVADIERIEVIRGPAGTLFGTNSTGGAINYITSGPSGELGAKQDFSYGRFGSFRSKTRIDLPEWNGISASISYLHNDKNSNVSNAAISTIDYSELTNGRVGKLTSARKLNESTTDAVHAAVRWEPLDDLVFNYKFDWTRQSYSPQAAYLLGFPDSPGGIGAYQLVAAQQFFGGPTLEDYINTSRSKTAYNDTTTEALVKTTSHFLSAEYQASEWLSVKNTTSFRSLKRNPFMANLDGIGLVNNPILDDDSGEVVGVVPLGILTSRCCQQLKQFSNELQLNINTDKLDATAGLFVYNRRTIKDGNPFGQQTVDAFQPYPGFVHIGAPLPSPLNEFFRAKQIAGYGQATYHLTDSFDITGGIRYTRDEKTFVDARLDNAGSAYEYAKGNFSYLANLAYSPSRELMLYLKYVTSFIAGGTSAGALARDSVTGDVFQGPAIPYSEEKARSWEAGIKADWFDRRLRTNLAVFHVNYDDLQTPLFSSSGCILSPNDICEPITSADYSANFGKARAYGAEFEITAVPIENLTLSASGSYTDFDFLEISPQVLANSPVTEVKDYPESLRPKLLTNLSVNYVVPLAGDMDLSFRLEGNYRSSVVITTSKFSNAGFDLEELDYDNSYLNAMAKQKSLFTINARATLGNVPLGPTNGTLSIWGRNLTNKQQLNFIANTGVTASGLFDDPATYGVDLRVEF